MKNVRNTRRSKTWEWRCRQSKKTGQDAILSSAFLCFYFGGLSLLLFVEISSPSSSLYTFWISLLISSVFTPDFFNFFIRKPQHTFGISDPDLLQIGCKRNAVLFLKQPCQVMLINIEQFRRRFQCDFLMVIFIQIMIFMWQLLRMTIYGIWESMKSWACFWPAWWESPGIRESIGKATPEKETSGRWRPLQRKTGYTVSCQNVQRRKA